MIVDAYVQVGAGLGDDPSRALEDVSTEGILDAVFDTGVECAIVTPANWGASWIDPSFERSNEMVGELVATHGGRCAGLGRVNPRYGPGAVDLAQRCLENDGFVGLALSPAADGFHLSDEKLLAPVLEVVQAHRGWVVWNLGYFHYPSTQPIHALALAERYPDVPMVLGHIGNRVTTDAVMVAERCPNVKLLTCGMPSLSLRNLSAHLGEENLVFASDAPYGVPAYEVQRVRETDGLSDELGSRILGGTAMALLERRIGAPHATPSA